MKRTILVLAAVIAVAAVSALVASDASEEGAQTLAGSYKWVNADNPGDLRAEFTTTGDETWDVVFHFRFRGRPHAYTGTAEGSLWDGALRGKVKNENERRSFAFEGEFEDGTFSGTHSELRDGEVRQTGTLELSQSSGDS